LSWENRGNSYEENIQFFTFSLGVNNKGKRAPNLEKGGWENSRACWNIFGAFWSWKMKNSVVRPEE
jgi:hypothetical protein